MLKSLNNTNIIYYKDRGTFDDDNITWCVYSLTSYNVRPDIDLSNNQHNIGLFHGPIEGSTTDIGFKFDDGFSLDRFEGLERCFSW